MKRISISDIDLTLNYQGYLWLSDSKEPIILREEKIPQGIFKNLPFVVEGYLYCKSKNGLSIKTKYIDGAYQVFSVELDQVPSDRLTQNEFVAIKNKKDIKFIRSVQYWEDIPDNLCEKMNTLEPAWVAFNGFN